MVFPFLSSLEGLASPRLGSRSATRISDVRSRWTAYKPCMYGIAVYITVLLVKFLSEVRNRLFNMRPADLSQQSMVNRASNRGF
jgi:hypothetical protein